MYLQDKCVFRTDTREGWSIYVQGRLEKSSCIILMCVHGRYIGRFNLHYRFMHRNRQQQKKRIEAEKTEQPEITDETTEDAQKSEVQTEAVNQEEEQSVSTYIAPLVEEQEVPVLGAPDGVTELTDANTAIVLSASTYTYDGTEKKPTVTVVCNGVRLTQNTDFLLTYADHVNAGTASH